MNSMCKCGTGSYLNFYVVALHPKTTFFSYLTFIFKYEPIVISYYMNTCFCNMTVFSYLNIVIIAIYIFT